MSNNYMKFKNDAGVAEIGIGVTEFKCAGEAPPQDHPHVYINMGNDKSILCPYCATKYVYLSYLGHDETQPPGNFLEEEVGKELC